MQEIILFYPRLAFEEKERENRGRGGGEGRKKNGVWEFFPLRGDREKRERPIGRSRTLLLLLLCPPHPTLLFFTFRPPNTARERKAPPFSFSLISRLLIPPLFLHSLRHRGARLVDSSARCVLGRGKGEAFFSNKWQRSFFFKVFDRIEKKHPPSSSSPSVSPASRVSRHSRLFPLTYQWSTY